MKNLTIIIPCKDDRKIKECMKSIDLPGCEIFVVYNGAETEFIREMNAYVQEHFSDLKYSFWVLDKANLAKALEIGTQKAGNDLVLYMDSDCIFRQGSIKEFLKKAEETDMANNVLKGTVVFEQGNTWLERIIADSRTHHTAEVLTAYKPPLLLSKQMIPKIGGYAFDTRLIWREDSDLDYRIREAGIHILPVEAGIIYHQKITLKTDLRSTFRYGIGLAIANVLQIKLTEVPRSTYSAFRKKGIKTALYMFFRNRVYHAGYLYARIRMKWGKCFGE